MESFNQFFQKSEKWLTCIAKKASAGTAIDYMDLLQDSLIAADEVLRAGGSQAKAAYKAAWTIRQSARKGRLISGRERATDPTDMDQYEPHRLALLLAGKELPKRYMRQKTAQEAFNSKFGDALTIVWKTASRPVKAGVQWMLEGHGLDSAAEKAGLSEDQLRDALELVGRKAGGRRKAACVADLPLFACFTVRG